MVLSEFKLKLNVVKMKAEQVEYFDDILTFDEDRESYIWIDEKGFFHFADMRFNWVDSHLNVSSVENIRFAKGRDEDVEEGFWSNISIHFSSDEIVEFYFEEWRGGAVVYVTFLGDEEKIDSLRRISELCNREHYLEFKIKE